MERIQTIRADEVSRKIDENSGLLFIHFGSPLASSCEVVHGALENLAVEFDTRVAFAELEIPLQDLDLIQKYALETIPTLILYRGDDEVERLEQLMQEEELREFLEMASSFHGASDSASQRQDDHL